MDTKLIIFDLDGTLADCTHRLHHITGDAPDWDSFYDDCDHDQPISDARWAFVACKTLMYTGDAIKNDAMVKFKIEIWTGRDERVRAKTIDWLERKAFGHVDKIRMRTSGDHRQDYIVKEEWLKEVGAKNVAFVFEDRDQVVEMYRRNGVTCFQVAEGKY